MAEKGHVKSIKDGGDGGGAVAGTAVALAGEDPTTIIISVTSDRSGVQYDFNLPYFAAMNINIGDLVLFDVLDGGGNKPTVPVYMERIQQGTIKSINADGASGTIAEKGSGAVINFYQAHLADLNIKAGDDVRYTLVNTGKGAIAVNVHN